MPTIKRVRKPWQPKRKTNSKMGWSKDERYHSPRWRKYVKDYKKRNPLCAICKRPVHAVDHVKPVRKGGDFWSKQNHQPLCESCHNRKSRQERD